MDDGITHNSNKCVICQQDNKEGTNLVRVGKNGLAKIKSRLLLAKIKSKSGSVSADL